MIGSDRMKKYIDGECRIPADPERMVKALPENKTRRVLRKFRHYAHMLLGTRNMAMLEKRRLMVVPQELVRDYLEFVDRDELKTETHRSTISVDKSLLANAHIMLGSMIQYIEMARPGNELRWHPDGKTLVTDLPDFGYAKEAEAELKAVLTSYRNNAPT